MAGARSSNALRPAYSLSGFVSGRQQSAATWSFGDVAAATVTKLSFPYERTAAFQNHRLIPELASATTQPNQRKEGKNHVASRHHLPDDPVPRPPARRHHRRRRHHTGLPSEHGATPVRRRSRRLTSGILQSGAHPPGVAPPGFIGYRRTIS